MLLRHPFISQVATQNPLDHRSSTFQLLSSTDPLHYFAPTGAELPSAVDSTAMGSIAWVNMGDASAKLHGLCHAKKYLTTAKEPAPILVKPRASQNFPETIRNSRARAFAKPQHAKEPGSAAGVNGVIKLPSSMPT